jgi:ubiquinone biosynthesis protein COQ4
VDDAELAFVVGRMREVHDFWHVLFGCHTNVFGELALKGLEFVQASSPWLFCLVLLLCAAYFSLHWFHRWVSPCIAL